VTQRNCSIRELSKHVGLSPSTVSRILNNNMGNVRVAEKTRKRVLEAAKELNYSPNINALRLFGNKTNIIGLLVPSYDRLGMHVFDDNHLVKIVSGLEKSLRENQFNLLLIFNDDNFVKEKKHIELFRSRQIDGLLVWGARIQDSYWEEVAVEHYPLLFISTLPQNKDKFNYIVTDPCQSVKNIACKMIAAGYKKFLWIKGHDDIYIVKRQEDGMINALIEHGISPESLVIRKGDFTAKSGEMIAEEIVRKKIKIDAVLSSNSMMANGFAGKMPANTKIGIASFDSPLLIRKNQIKSYSIEYPDYKIGVMAGKSIATLITKEKSSVQKIFQGKIVE